MKIKLLRVPHYSYIKQSNQKMKCENFPPLAPAVITSYLRGKGIGIEQDDLNVKVHYDNVYNTDYSGRVDGKIFHDKERVMNFINGSRDSELENVGENILKKSNVDSFDLILLSIPSLIDISPLLSTLVIAKILKEKTGCKIIAGGGSGAELEIGMREGIIDYLGSEHGEVLSECFIRAVESGRDVDNIPGLSYLKDGVMYSNPNTTPIVLPCPDFDGIPLDKYIWRDDFFTKKHNLEKRDILILPFRHIIGCPFRCAFCCESAKEKNLVCLEATRAVDYIQSLSEKYRTNYFFFLHSTANFSREFINAFCDEIIRRGLKLYWTDCANFTYLDKGILEKMRRAGAVRLIWGLETGSPRLLRYINKGITVQKAEEMLKIADDIGIWNGLEIIAGLPGEKEEDIRLTIDFLLRNESHIDTVFFNPYFLDGSSLMSKFPGRYGITNVKPIHKYASLKTRELVDNYPFNFAFDEIDGLKWEEKMKQIASSCTRVITQTRGGFWSYETESVLFYLYSLFDDKVKIKKLYNEWACEVSR